MPEQNTTGGKLIARLREHSTEFILELTWWLWRKGSISLHVIIQLSCFMWSEGFYIIAPGNWAPRPAVINLLLILQSKLPRPVLS